jgi:para-nitrobenzyl esterase
MTDVSEPIVRTASGTVSGSTSDGYSVFKGIPFAAAPIGRLRFRPPQPPASWEGIRPCVEPGAACPQPGFTDVLRFGELIDPDERQDEDCLYLNVWTPGCDDAKRPVIMWIHGGYWIQGSGSLSQYDGGTFARDDIVFVTVNYRLGGLGFVYLDELFDDLEGTANLGILDNVAALEWVHENIASFGGDPDNVTISGQSAGGGQVATLLATPSAKGLFRRAAPMSSAGHYGLSTDDATNVARAYLGLVGLMPGETDALLTAPAETLLVDYMQMKMTLMPLLSGAWLSAFCPVNDGRTLPKPVLQAVAEGHAAGVDLLTGACADEWRLGYWGIDWDKLGIPEDMAAVLFSDLEPWVTGIDRPADEVRKVYDASVEAALGRPSTDPDVWAAIAADRQFIVPTQRLADLQRAHTDNVWAYRFAWPSPVLDGSIGAAHGLDIPFFFDNLSFGAGDVLGDDPPQSLADAMHASLVAFARTGDPNTRALPKWPRYDARRRATMQLDVSPRVVNDPEGERRALYEGVI